MKTSASIQEFIDNLGMAELLVSIGGDTPCGAIMDFYTDPGKIEYAKTEIRGITYNSKDVCEGFLFVCKGANFKEEYLAEALRRGAVCYVREAAGEAASNACDISDAGRDEGAAKTGVNCEDALEIRVSDIRKAMTVIAETFYGKLSDDIKVVGITGTKGKSSTAFFMRYILDDYLGETEGKKSAICSGLENYDGVIDEPSHLTTPEVMEVYKHMDNAVKSGIKYMTMEVSSQGLKYDRVGSIDFEVGVFLNIGTDHISPIEHPDFDDYFESKLKIFGQCRKACYSLDADEQERIKAASVACPEVITFSQKNEAADVFAYEVISDEGHVRIKVRGSGIAGYEDFDEEFALGTFGSVNAENALAAISAAALLGVPMKYIKSSLSKAYTPGRMEMYKSDDGKKIVIVDYAHNKLSFDKFYEMAAKEFPGRRIITVFGSTGGKAIVRREELGTSAGLHSDYTIVTEDDSAGEDVIKICEEIAEAIEAAGGSYEIIPERVDAIKKAISLMDDNSILFVAGKGNETQMKRAGGYVDYPADAVTVKKYING